MPFFALFTRANSNTCSAKMAAMLCFVLILTWIVQILSLITHQVYRLPKSAMPPQLVLISGSTGVGKTTLAMNTAANHGILRCVSTDTIRQVLRTVSDDSAVHRSSYSGCGDPIGQWQQTCMILQPAIQALVTDSIRRGIPLILEGVHVLPARGLLEQWRSSGGQALGCVLTVTDPDKHRALLQERGVTQRGAEAKLQAFDRIRVIQEEMLRLADHYGWMRIEQEDGVDPLEQLNKMLGGG